MENKETFQYTYSAAQQAQVEHIRKKYLPRQESDMEQLLRLDAIPGKKARAWSIALGIIGALIMGTGMSLAMTDLGEALGTLAMVLGVVVGLVGIALVALAYPVYCRVLEKQRRLLAPQILELSQKLMQ